jgi:tRNA(Ile)-lysidine synthase
LMKLLLNKIRRTLSSHNMIGSGDKVLVALSGGSDSVALLALLRELSEDLQIKLFAAHLNHLSRGEDSYKDAQFVKKLCEDWNIKTYFAEKNVKKEKDKLKRSFQETARILRYEFFLDVLKDIEGDKIALGHTADDQAETVLINLTRGAGLKGISGIPPVRRELVRPLIECQKKELLKYLEDSSIHYCTDSTNASDIYLRNRVRSDFIPYLKENFNPNIVNRLSDMTKLIRDDMDLLNSLTQEYFEKLSYVKNFGESVSLKLSELNLVKLGLKKRILLAAIEFIKGDLRSIESGHINSLEEFSRKNVLGKTLQIPCFIEAVLSKELLILRKKRKNEKIVLITTLRSIEVPGKTVLKDLGLEFNCRLVDRNSFDFNNKNGKEEFFDFEKIGNTISCRFFEAGDRFVPLGMQGIKKVKSYFIDEKIPRNERNRIPILINGKNDIIWIYGHRIGNNFRVQEKTRQIIAIQGRDLSLLT